jgi:uncharacterized protein YkwD
VNYVVLLRRLTVGMLAAFFVALLASNVLASSGPNEGAQSPSIAVNLSTGPSTVANGEAELQPAAIRYAAYLPIIQQPGDPVDLPLYDAATQRMLQLVNAERGRAGCAPVTMNERLTRAAQVHTGDMAGHDFVGHQGTDGTWPHERVLREGYNYAYVGESVAKSTNDTADHVFSLWMNSPGHAAIIVTCTAQEIGIGHLPPYWTLVLGKIL